LSRFDVVGTGPGIGTAAETRKMIGRMLSESQHPMVVDADALNGIADEKKLLEKLPAGSILTPHPREFGRLFGDVSDDFERIHLAVQEAERLQVIIVLKGHHTLIAAPGQPPLFNSTGNAGMATGGSGDVLTGMLTALLAQGYSPFDAARLGVYLHGLAGDLAAAENSEEALIASDITGHIGAAFIDIRSGNG